MDIGTTWAIGLLGDPVGLAFPGGVPSAVPRLVEWAGKGVVAVANNTDEVKASTRLIKPFRLLDWSIL